MDDYEDIIDLEKVEPNSKHPRMSIYNRSAIFAPFAALNGFDDEVSETARLTDKKIELSDDLKNIINDKLINLKNNQEINIEYFVKDSRKSGGKYINKIGIIKKIDYIKKEIIFIDKTIIKIDNIIKIKEI